MSGLVSVIAGGLAAVLLFSAGAKLLEPNWAAAAIMEFRVARRKRTLYARVLATAELLLGTALLMPSRLILAMALVTAVLLFGLFTALQVAALRRGERFACGCFGDDQPISPRTVIRTAALCALAATGAIVAQANVPSFEITFYTALGGLSLFLALRSLSSVRRYALFD